MIDPGTQLSIPAPAVAGAQNPHASGRPLTLLLLALCGILTGTTGCNSESAKAVQASSKADAGTPHKAPRQAPSATAVRVEVATLELSEASLQTTIPGEVDGSRDATLASALGGPVERLLVKEGQHVKRGQLLVLVDSALYSIRQRQARTQLETAQRELKRAKNAGSALPTAELDRRQSAVDAAQVDFDMASLQLKRARIVSPFGGVVSKIHTEVGEVVSPTAPLVDLVQLDPVHVQLSVPDRDVVALEPDAPVEVRVAALPTAFAGRIARISPTGDRDTRAFEAEVAVDNPDLTLKPGMIASVSIARTLAEGATVIPQDWLVTRRDGVGVFVDEDGEARFIPVKPGQVVRDQVVIAEGLSPGARIVIKGHRSLATGDKLSIAREGTCCENGRAKFD